ncbi:MAG: hypothetical protein KAG20_11200 [Cocleimonas sp.]|nr:hypothetical protein [Cocleimonas sp.]
MSALLKPTAESAPESLCGFFTPKFYDKGGMTRQNNSDIVYQLAEEYKTLWGNKPTVCWQ